MPTSLRGIANKAVRNQADRFQNLMQLLPVGFLLRGWRLVNKRAAAGVDLERAYHYAQNLESNVSDLAERVKGGWYRAQ